jgi:hypothetical protein
MVEGGHKLENIMKRLYCKTKGLKTTVICEIERV